jgi:hypothetical protein
MGLVSPEAGQVQRLEPGGTVSDMSILARAGDIAVVSGDQ